MRTQSADVMKTTIWPFKKKFTLDSLRKPSWLYDTSSHPNVTFETCFFFFFNLAEAMLPSSS